MTSLKERHLSDSELDMLMEQIRQELKSPATHENSTAKPVRDDEIFTPSWLPDFGALPTGDRVGIAELARYPDREFVVACYKVLLGRGPEPAGLNLYLEGLRSGRLSKVDVIGALRYSSEGQRRGVVVPGLRIRYLVGRVYRLPLIGTVLRWIVAFLRLPSQVRAIMQLDAGTSQRFLEYREILNHDLEALRQAFHEIDKLWLRNVDGKLKNVDEKVKQVEQSLANERDFIGKTATQLNLDADRRFQDLQAELRQLQGEIDGLKRVLEAARRDGRPGS